MTIIQLLTIYLLTNSSFCSITISWPSSLPPRPLSSSLPGMWGSWPTHPASPSCSCCLRSGIRARGDTWRTRRRARWASSSEYKHNMLECGLPTVSNRSLAYMLAESLVLGQLYEWLLSEEESQSLTSFYTVTMKSAAAREHWKGLQRGVNLWVRLSTCAELSHDFANWFCEW